MLLPTCFKKGAAFCVVTGRQKFLRIFVLTSLAMAVTQMVSLGEPSLRIPTNNVIGECFPGETTKGTLSVTNNGDNDLVIHKIVPTCRCTTLGQHFPIVIRPKKSTSIEVSYETSESDHTDVSGALWFVTNDPIRQTFRVFVSVRIKPHLACRITPERHPVIRIDNPDTSPVRFFLDSLNASGLEVHLPGTFPSGVDILFQETAGRPAGALDIMLDPSRLPFGRQTYTIPLFVDAIVANTAFSSTRTLTVDIDNLIAHRWLTFSRSDLRIGALPNAGEQTARVTVNYRGPFAGPGKAPSLRIEDNREVVKADISFIDSTWQIDLSPRSGADGLLKTDVLFVFDLMNESVIVDLPYLAYIIKAPSI